MSKTEPDDHAFPIDTEDGNWPLANGLTKREYFAAVAMQGLLANEEEIDLAPRQTALVAVRHADYLISELNSRSHIPRG